MITTGAITIVLSIGCAVGAVLVNKFVEWE
jgi:hypothetical protein